jgi:hypothetical protein
VPLKSLEIEGYGSLRILKGLDNHTTIPIRRINVGHYCNSEEYPNGKPIVIDKDAQRTLRGDYKCGECIDVERRRRLVSALGPLHPVNKESMDKEDISVDKWNNYAKAINELNRKMGGEQRTFSSPRTTGIGEDVECGGPYVSFK